jgi:CheY-like chemotaxis protein
VRFGANAQNLCVDGDSDPERRPTVLLVEDNEVNQAVAVAILNRRGYRVDVVENGREALAAVERRSREQGDSHLPVIALTAHASERERCLACGMDDFLTKPVRPEDLVDALARVIGEEQVVDRGVLARLREALDEHTVARIVDVFIAQGTDQLATIAQSGDAAEVTRAAHLRKASAATVGAVAVEGIAGEIERTGDPTLAWRLAEAFARTRAELR